MENTDHLRPPEPDQLVVLVADDEVVIQDLARITLEHAGYFVITAKDGMVAQALSRDYPGKIHVLLTDLNMPNMGGLELSEWISADRPDIQILVMSGDHFAENITSKFSFLHKPFAPQELCEAIRRLNRIHDPVRR